MKKHIAEELPARKHQQGKMSPISKPQGGGNKLSKKDRGDRPVGGAKGGTTPEERISQAASDIRYRARREEIPLTQAYSEYMQHSNMSQVEKSAVKKKLAGKDGAMKEDYQIEDLASTTVAKALFKVFVEGVSKEEEKEEVASAKDLYFEEAGRVQDRKYKVRVTGTDGRSYVRYATREKINQLRANPNIKEVEMTEYGEPYEGEKKRGEQTARAKAGKGLDPVGKEDGDIDNDGDKDKTDGYLLNRRKVRGAAISGRQTQREEFLGEVKKNKNKDENKKIDVMKGKNDCITINPPESKSNLMAHTEIEGEVIFENGYSKFLGMLQEKKLTKAETAKKEEIAKSLKKKYGKTAKTYAIATAVAKKVAEAAECGCEDEEPKLKKSEGGVTDPREIPTKVNLMKNKLRAMGLKMSYEPEGDQIDEVLGGQAGDGYIGHPRLGIKNPLAKKQTTTNTAPENTGIAGRLGNRASRLDADMKELRQSYEPEGEVIDELRRSEKEGKGSPEERLPSGHLVGQRGERKRKGAMGGRHQYSGSQEYGGSQSERGKKKNEPGSQHQRLNPPERTGRQLQRGSAAAMQRWHSPRD